MVRARPVERSVRDIDKPVGPDTGCEFANLLGRKAGALKPPAHVGAPLVGGSR